MKVQEKLVTMGIVGLILLPVACSELPTQSPGIAGPSADVVSVYVQNWTASDVDVSVQYEDLEIELGRVGSFGEVRFPIEEGRLVGGVDARFIATTVGESGRVISEYMWIVGGASIVLAVTSTGIMLAHEVDECELLGELCLDDRGY